MKTLKTYFSFFVILLLLTGCGAGTGTEDSGGAIGLSGVPSYHWDISTDSGNPTRNLASLEDRPEDPMISFIGPESVECDFFAGDSALPAVVLSEDGQVYGKIFANNIIPPEFLKLKCPAPDGHFEEVDFQPQPVEDFSKEPELSTFFYVDDAAQLVYLVLDAWLFTEPPVLITNYESSLWFGINPFGDIMIDGVTWKAVPIDHGRVWQFKPSEFTASYNRILRKALAADELAVYPITIEGYYNPPPGPPAAPYVTTCLFEPGSEASPNDDEDSIMVLGALLRDITGTQIVGQTLGVTFGPYVTSAKDPNFNPLRALPLQGATITSGGTYPYIGITCSAFGQNATDRGCGATFSYNGPDGPSSCTTYYVKSTR